MRNKSDLSAVWTTPRHIFSFFLLEWHIQYTCTVWMHRIQQNRIGQEFESVFTNSGGVFQALSLSEDLESLVVNSWFQLFIVTAQTGVHAMLRDHCSDNHTPVLPHTPHFILTYSTFTLPAPSCTCWGLDTSLALPLGLYDTKASLHVALEELRCVFEEGLQVCIRVLLFVLVQLSQTLTRKLDNVLKIASCFADSLL